MENITKYTFEYLKPIIQKIDDEYTDSFETNDSYELFEHQLAVRNDLKKYGITSKPDIYAFFIGLHTLQFGVNSWKEVNEILIKKNSDEVFVEDISFDSIFCEKKYVCACGKKDIKESNMYKLNFGDKHLLLGCVCIEKTGIKCIDIIKKINKNRKLMKKNIQKKCLSLITNIFTKDCIRLKSVLQKAFNKIKGNICKDCKKQCNYERCYLCMLKHTGQTLCECGKPYKYRNTSYTCCYNCNLKK